jgi:hypothetical protein
MPDADPTFDQNRKAARGDALSGGLFSDSGRPA